MADFLYVSSVQLVVLAAICVFLVLQQVAKKKGLLVKVEYSPAKRLSWALIIAAIVAGIGFMFGNMYLVVVAVAGGFYLYFYKQYYGFKRG